MRDIVNNLLIFNLPFTYLLKQVLLFLLFSIQCNTINKMNEIKMFELEVKCIVFFLDYF